MKKTTKLPWFVGIVVAILMIPFMGVTLIFVGSLFAFVMLCISIAAITGNLTVTTKEPR